ncbi:MAG: glycoside hydrolase family 15 protein [Steroidobacteraceae bacterium]|jgi:GH15 family glucan-1,4-alpha-glucosidase
MSDLDLAVIGNCQLNALIDRKGAVVWCCWPVPDGNPLFCSLLDQADGDTTRGMFAIDLIDQVKIEQHYERNTAVVETIMRDKQEGAIRILDFCPRFRRHGRLFRPSVLMRLIQPIGGRPRIRLRVKPMFNYGAEQPQCSVGSHHVSYGGEGGHVRVTTDASVAALMEEETFTLDRPITVMLGPDETVEDPMEDLGRQWLEHTRAYWLDWVRTLAIPFEWQEQVIRAAITLKLCTYEDTGAVLAALTTSIPEAAGTQRNWDYRFSWLRDAFFVIQALNRLGATRTMEGFLRYIDEVAAKGENEPLRPLYRLAGREPLTERVAPALAGYRGMGPVRVGNQAAEQNQHDVYGALVLAATQLFFDQRLAIEGSQVLFERLEGYGESAVQVFNTPDAGPWELRGTANIHTYSAVMCWAACDRLGRIATHLLLADKAKKWRAHAATIRDQILMHCWHEQRQVIDSTFDGSGTLDAALLLLPELGFIKPTDPRFLSTLKAIESELVVDGAVMRYRVADDFGVPSNAFTVCTFWYVNALARTNQRARAREVFEGLLSRSNHFGLLSEDIDPRSGELWGNFPQTYSMVGIINSAVRLSRSWDQMV